MLLDDLASALNLNGATARTFSILNLNGKGLHIEGAITIRNCSAVKVDLCIGKAAYSIWGENLKIQNLCVGSVTISGEIYGYYDSSKIKI